MLSAIESWKSHLGSQRAVSRLQRAGGEEMIKKYEPIKPFVGRLMSVSTILRCKVTMEIVRCGILMNRMQDMCANLV
jgi:hypothetical protein